MKIHENNEDKIVINGTYGDAVFTNNIATIKLKDGETKYIKNLPIGLKYVVTASYKNYRNTIVYTDFRHPGDIAVGLAVIALVIAALYGKRKRLAKLS